MSVRIPSVKIEYKATVMNNHGASTTVADVNIGRNVTDTRGGAVASGSAVPIARETPRNRVNTGTEGLQHKASPVPAMTASPGDLAENYLAAPGTPMSTLLMALAERAWVAAASRVIAATAEKVDVEKVVRAEEAKNGVEVRAAHLGQDRAKGDRGRPTIDASCAKTEGESGGAKMLSVSRTIARRGRDVRSLRP